MSKTSLRMGLHWSGSSEEWLFAVISGSGAIAPLGICRSSPQQTIELRLRKGVAFAGAFL